MLVAYQEVQVFPRLHLGFRQILIIFVRSLTGAVHKGDNLMNKALKLSLLLLTLTTFLITPALAQTTGSISGEVRDEKEAVIKGANVSVRNVKTNDTRTTQTDSDGRYRFSAMPVGDYEVTVESSGFAKYVQSGITLVLNQQATVNATMKTGGVAEVVRGTQGRCATVRVVPAARGGEKH